MSGFVFHPGHDEWHGQTVVVYTRGPRTLVGRWDAVSGGELLMRDVAVHEDPDANAREGWLAEVRQYGVPVEHSTFTLPHADVERVVRLRDA
jgi:hypothetical protein